MEVEMVYLFALSRGVLDSLTPEDLKKFKDGFIGLINREFPNLLREIRNSGVLNDSSREMLNEALKHYFATV
jgi:F0F1-type ATP synthase alpha subunit